MALDIDIYPQVKTPAAPAGRPAQSGEARPLSASFAELMAAADRGTPAPVSGPKPLAANLAELMAAADGRPVGGDTVISAAAMRNFDPRQRAVHAAPGSGGGIDFHLFGEDGLTFGDFIDVINPLQHIPIVGTIYRWLTGDDISPAASLAGGFLFGGPIGLAASAVNVVVDEVTGDDIGGNVMTAMFGESPLADQGMFNLADAPERTWGVAEPKSAPAAAPAIVAPPAPQIAAAAAQPPVAAPAPEAAGEAVALSEDQVAALLAMGGGQRALKPLPPPGPPAKTPPVRAASTAPAAAAGGDSTGISTQMMSALDKYQAMLKARAAAAPGPGPGPGGISTSA